MSLDSCSVGVYRNSACHQPSYTKEIGQVPATSLLEEEKELITRRVETEDGGSLSLVTICYHHKQYYLVRYPDIASKTCLDPFNMHNNAVPRRKKKKITANLLPLSLELIKRLEKKSLDLPNKLVPGRKVCVHCRKRLKDMADDESSASTLSSTGRLKIFEGQFLAVVYGTRWYIGRARDVNKKTGDMIFEFMHPAGPSPYYDWPDPGDLSYVPIAHVLRSIDPDYDFLTGKNSLPNDTTLEVIDAFNQFHATSA